MLLLVIWSTPLVPSCFVQVTPLSTDFLNLVLELLGYEKVSFVKADQLSPRDMEEMLDHLRNVPHLKQFLLTIMENDINRFYSCQDGERQMVRGARSRTNYFLNLISEDKKKQKVSFPNRYL